MAIEVDRAATGQRKGIVVTVQASVWRPRRFRQGRALGDGPRLSANQKVIVIPVQRDIGAGAVDRQTADRPGHIPSVDRERARGEIRASRAESPLTLGKMLNQAIPGVCPVRVIIRGG